MSFGKVFMMEVEVRRMLSFMAVKFIAMVAVIVDSTQALMPLPNPSDSTLMTRPSPFNFCDMKQSPQTTLPALFFWKKSTSMKLPLFLKTNAIKVVFCHLF